MTFKMGETCSGCDAIVKNLKKIAKENVNDNNHQLTNKPVGVKGMKDYMEDSVESVTGATMKVTENLNKVGKRKGGMYKIHK